MDNEIDGEERRSPTLTRLERAGIFFIEHYKTSLVVIGLLFWTSVWLVLKAIFTTTTNAVFAIVLFVIALLLVVISLTFFNVDQKVDLLFEEDEKK